MRTVFGFIASLFIATFFVSLAQGQEIKHKFLMADESRDQLIYVDQSDSSKNFVIPIEGKTRGMQLLDGDRVLLGVFAGGFREFDLKTRKLAREVLDKNWAAGSVAAWRLPDGRTLLALDRDPAQIVIVDKNGKEEKSLSFPGKRSIRCVTITPRGTMLFGCNENQLIEADLDGKILKEIKIEGARYVYMPIETKEGEIIVSNGFGGTVFQLDSDGKIVKKWGGTPSPAGSTFMFFASPQMLKNGNVVTANWPGHGAQDSDKAEQVIEFDKDGKVVWSWNDPKTTGSIHNVIVLE